MKKIGLLLGIIGIVIIAIIWSIIGAKNSNNSDTLSAEIQPSKKYKQYWHYKGKDVVLLGGSSEDNLFQISDLDDHLDLLLSVGGNYVRNTMSSRDEGNLWPFFLGNDSLYNLDKWNDDYWLRFEEFLEATAERNIIVQIEIWATFDFYRDNWLVNPFNPINNSNYTARRVHLDEEVDSHPIFTENNFFRSVPNQLSLLRLLEYQQKFVDKILSYTLKYDHILFCIDNETSVTSDWGKYWAKYLLKKGIEAGKNIQTTEMWDPWDLNHMIHRETMDNPGIFTFVDISQNNHNSGEKHWANGIKQIEHLKKIGALRPCNNVKIYGNDGGRHQTTQNGIECFIRNILMGSASARFHRPTSGQGLNETAQKVIQATRILVDEMDFFNGGPLDNTILEKEPNEAYCRGIYEKEYVIYFTKGGEIVFNLDIKNKTGLIRWFSVDSGKWINEEEIESGERVIIRCPGNGNWFAFIN